MKMTMCDVCWRRDGKLSIAGWKASVPSSIKGQPKLTVDLCDSHKGWAKGKNFNQILEGLHHQKEA
jgi:hypothetical protein